MFKNFKFKRYVTRNSNNVGDAPHKRESNKINNLINKIEKNKDPVYILKKILIGENGALLINGKNLLDSSVYNFNKSNYDLVKLDSIKFKLLKYEDLNIKFTAGVKVKELKFNIKNKKINSYNFRVPKIKNNTGFINTYEFLDYADNFKLEAVDKKDLVLEVLLRLVFKNRKNDNERIIKQRITKTDLENKLKENPHLLIKKELSVNKNNSFSLNNKKIKMVSKCTQINLDKKERKDEEKAKRKERKQKQNEIKNIQKELDHQRRKRPSKRDDYQQIKLEKKLEEKINNYNNKKEENIKKKKENYKKLIKQKEAIKNEIKNKKQDNPRVFYEAQKAVTIESSKGRVKQLDPNSVEYFVELVRFGREYVETIFEKKFEELNYNLLVKSKWNKTEQTNFLNDFCEYMEIDLREDLNYKNFYEQVKKMDPSVVAAFINQIEGNLNLELKK